MYEVIIKKSVEKDLRKISSVVQKNIIFLIESLADDPRPDGVTKLRGEKDMYRVRSGDYRIIYQIQDKKLIVRIIKVGHRSDVYRA